MVLAIASTAMPFARSPEEQAERWLRVLRLHGEVGIALQALGVSEVPLIEAHENGDGGLGGSAELEDGDVMAGVTEHAADVATRRGSAGVTTVDLLVAVMYVYGTHFNRVLEAHGTDCDEVRERLGIVSVE
jgi:hypothetical protein